MVCADEISRLKQLNELLQRKITEETLSSSNMLDNDQVSLSNQSVHDDDVPSNPTLNLSESQNLSLEVEDELVERINGMEENTDFDHMDVGIEPQSQEICPTEWFQGYGACNTNSCSLNHEINFTKLARGVCINEFFQKGSCRNVHDCRFCHELPEAARHDQVQIDKINEKLNRWRAKKKGYAQTHTFTGRQRNIGRSSITPPLPLMSTITTYMTLVSRIKIGLS